MSFQTVWVFTAIIMVCVITDMVEAQYRFPIYYRIARYDGDNQGTQDNEVNRGLETLTDPNKHDLRPIPRTHDRSDTNINPQGLKAINPSSQPSEVKTDYRTPYKRVSDGILYQNIRRSSSKPTSWRIEGNEDKENWSEKHAIIRQFLLKSWTDWNKESKHGNGKDDLNQ